MNKNKKYILAELLIASFIITKNITSIECFSNNVWINNFCSIIELLCYATLLFKCSKIRVTTNKMMLMVILFILFSAIYVQSKTLAFVFGIILYYSSGKVDFIKIMELSWKTYFSLIVFSFILYFLGFSDGGIDRTYNIARQAKAFGFTHPNVGGGWITMMLLSKLYVDYSDKIKSKKKIGIINLLFYIISIYISYFVLKCRTTIVAIAIFILCRILINNRNIERKFIGILIKCLQPLILLFTIIGAIVYPYYGMNALDNILAHRIFLCHYHYLMNGLSLFGKTIDYSKYTLDNSYMTFSLQFGIIPMIVFSIISILAIGKACKKSNSCIIAVAVTIFVYGYMENGIFDLTTNFVFLYLLTGNSLNDISNKKINNTYYNPKSIIN